MKTSLFPFLTAVAVSLSSLSAQTTASLPVTAEEQKALTPDSVLKDLMEGNARYVAEKHTAPNAKASIAAAVSGQYPKAYILSCIDSRVPVELVFDQGLGDVFVGRVAGNIENVDQLGSMEYAAAVTGVKLVMVLGHESCGAVKGACDHVELGNITGLLSNIKPAVEKVASAMKEGDDKTSKNKDFVAKVVETNVMKTIADIRKNSPTLADLEKEGKIKIVGGVYSLHTGKVTPVTQ